VEARTAFANHVLDGLRSVKSRALSSGHLPLENNYLIKEVGQRRCGGEPAYSRANYGGLLADLS
jgi:hypothetical protein